MKYSEMRQVRSSLCCLDGKVKAPRAFFLCCQGIESRGKGKGVPGLYSRCSIVYCELTRPKGYFTNTMHTLVKARQATLEVKRVNSGQGR